LLNTDEFRHLFFESPLLVFLDSFDVGNAFLKLLHYFSFALGDKVCKSQFVLLHTPNSSISDGLALFDCFRKPDFALVLLAEERLESSEDVLIFLDERGFSLF
jgi:hypothetical protein